MFIEESLDERNKPCNKVIIQYCYWSSLLEEGAGLVLAGLGLLRGGSHAGEYRHALWEGGGGCRGFDVNHRSI